MQGASGRRYAGVDPQERQRLRRAKLVDAALAVFGAKGYHQATVRDVCKAAQLTSRYFYESFEGMESLFRVVYAQVNRQLMESTLEVLEHCPSDIHAMSEAALRNFLEFIRDDPRRARVMLIDALNVGEGMYSLANQINQDFAELIAGYLQQFMPNLAGSGLDAQVLSDGLVGAANRIATQWVGRRCQAPLDVILSNSLALFEATIEYAGRKSGAPLIPIKT
ncbi:TetR/AcrR family transcriptional regulator [Aquabacterium sp.]|uniref:TetR/AcrR family transcriptional regulator n=1 Tax=Aquabacterium sp. TaxID=1872578 RepID=UPI0035B37DC9